MTQLFQVFVFRTVAMAEVKVNPCALPLVNDDTFLDGMRVADLVVDIGPLAWEVSEQKLRRGDLFENPSCDPVVMLKFIGPSRLYSELGEYLTDSVQQVLKFWSLLIDLHHDECSVGSVTARSLRGL